MEENINPEQKKEEREQVIELGSDITRNSQGSIYTLTIIGQVEGHQILPENLKTTKYEHVLPLLAGIEESDDIDGLLLLLNTVGGDIEAGLAIAEMIAGMKKPTVSLVLGGGHSIGIPLAVEPALFIKQQSCHVRKSLEILLDASAFSRRCRKSGISCREPGGKIVLREARNARAPAPALQPTASAPTGRMS